MEWFTNQESTLLGQPPNSENQVESVRVSRKGTGIQLHLHRNKSCEWLSLLFNVKLRTRGNLLWDGFVWFWDLGHPFR